MVSWLIVGRGPHGVHHLDLDPWSLQNFARHWAHCEEPFRAPYNRPAVPLFAAHCRSVIDRYGLDECRHTAKATAVRPAADGTLRVQTDRGELEARHVVLALGSGGAQAWPEWARPVREAQPERIQHAFDPGFNLDDREDLRTVAVVGGGITAAQLALRLCRLGRRVTLVCRHRVRRQQFDSDPMWLGPAKMGPFARLEDPVDRRRAIDRARHRGSMPADVHREFRSALHHRELRAIRSPVRGCIALQDAVVLALAERSLEVDAIALATGSPASPGATSWQGFASKTVSSGLHAGRRASTSICTGKAGSTAPERSPSSSSAPSPATSPAPAGPASAWPLSHTAGKSN